MTTVNHAPDSLKYQWRLLGLTLRSEWATGLDKSIAYEIIDNYMKEHGNSRASLTYLEKATGADRKSVIASTRRIVENGPFSIGLLGAGTRPTAYNLHFDLVAENASGGADTTTSQSHSSGGAEPTTGGGVHTTTSAPSSGVDSTQTDLRVDGLQAGVPVSNEDVSACLASANAVPAAGFEDGWKAYGKYGNKKASREAWAAIVDPDVTLIIEKAASWRATAKPDQKRMPFEKWLAAERYDEADRRLEEKPAAKDGQPKKAAKLAGDGEPFTEKCEFFTVREARWQQSTNNSMWLEIDIVSREGIEDCMMFCLESKNGELQAKDKERFSQLANAIGIEILDYDLAPLHEANFIRALHGKFDEYTFYPAWADAEYRKTILPPPTPAKPTGLRLWGTKPPDTVTCAADVTWNDDDSDDDLAEAA